MNILCLTSIIIIASINNYKINAKCNRKTTEIVTTADSFENANKIVRSTLPSKMMPTEVYFPSLTTPDYDTCGSVNGFTKSYGYWINTYFDRHFDFKFSDLSSIIVFSGRFVNGIRFYYLNGAIETVGNYGNGMPMMNNQRFPINKTTLIDLVNKTVIAINIRTEAVIKSIQFLIHDLSENTLTWTPVLGGHCNFCDQLQLDVNIIKHEVSDFHITIISGYAGYGFIKTLQFGYTFEKCKFLQKSMPPVPFIPTLLPTTTILTSKTTTKTQQIITDMIRTTITPLNIMFNECKTLVEKFSPYNYYIDMLGFLKRKSNFTIAISDLKALKVYSRNRLYGLSFIFKNGESLEKGYTNKCRNFSRHLY